MTPEDAARRGFVFVGRENSQRYYERVVDGVTELEVVEDPEPATADVLAWRSAEERASDAARTRAHVR